MPPHTQDILRHWREAVPNDRMAHLIRDTERAFRRALQVRLAPHGVPFGHWSFLRILWESDGLTQKELSERAGVMEPTTFAAMKTMEALGYISRQQLPTNKKNIYVYLTPQGRALKELLVPLAEETNRISTTDIKPAELATARRVLLAMLGNLARDELAMPEAAPDNDKPVRKRKSAKSAPDAADAKPVSGDEPARRKKATRRAG